MDVITKNIQKKTNEVRIWEQPKMLLKIFMMNVENLP